jgi:hypothetical protein
MTTIQIADVEAALGRVRAFIELLDQNHAQWDAAGSGVGVGSSSAVSAGLLSSLGEADQILGPRGPKLSAASLHPWIWNAAVSLWDDDHRREAVQAAATALFDQHLPAKLGVPGPPEAARIKTRI